MLLGPRGSRNGPDEVFGRHRLPSKPNVMNAGKLPAVGTGNSVKAPCGVIRPILLP